MASVNSHNTTKRSIGEFLLTLGCFLTVFGPLAGVIRLWDIHGTILSPAGSVTTVIGALFVITGFAFSKGHPQLSPWGMIASFWILICSDWITRDYSLLPGPAIRGEILFGALLTLLFFYKNPKRFLFLWLGGSAILLWSFFDASHGRFIFSDDHSVVVYRLSLLKEHFPFIPFYNPLWNSGLDARDFFATGILNLFILGAPLIYLFDPQSIYNILVSGVLFVLLPGLVFLSMKIDEEDTATASIAALLSIATNLLWYRWGIKYGSMGFVTSTALLPFNFVVAKRLIFNETINARLVAFFVVTATLMLFWSLSGVVFIPAIALALWRIRTVLSQSRIRKVIAWILCLNLPWIFLFLSVSKVGHFVAIKGESAHQESSTESEDDTATPEVKKSFSPDVVKKNVHPVTPQRLLKAARETALPANPLLLLCTLPGLLLIRKRSTKLFFGMSFGWLLLLGFFVSPLKPQLELDRMLIILGILSSMPTAITCRWIYEWSLLNRTRKSFASILFGTVFASIFSVGAILYNRTPEIYTFADDVFYQLGDEIKKSVGDGRGVFIGFVLHELNFGHLAPLMQQTEKPLVASTLYHNLWNYTNLIPKEYMSKGDAGIEEYLDLMNTSVVIAHEKNWRDYLFQKPESYTFISRVGVFNIFSRKTFPNTYYLEGSGTFQKQDSSSVTLTPHTTEAVIKFTYYPFLQSTGCTMSPYPLPGDITFIKLSNCTPDQEITITAKTGFKRLLP